jgi:hypothetical protein
VRVVLGTDSATLAVEFLATIAHARGQDPRPSSFDLVVDGELVATESSLAGNRLVLDPVDPTAFELVPGELGTVTFQLPPGSADRRIEVWMPSSCVLRAHSVSVDDGAEVRAAAPSGRPRWIHHGSSISHCIEALGGSRVWPAVAPRLGGVDLLNLGLAGQCQLDQFSARTIREQPADLLSLKVGINLVNAASMNLRTFPSALHGFLDTVREGHPDAPFLVVSPIWCRAHEDTPGPSGSTPAGDTLALGTDVAKAQGALTLRRCRQVVADVVAARRAAGDANLHHLDGLELFGEADEDDLPDGLHPNGEGYVRIGERFAAHAFAPGGPLEPGGALEPIGS